MSAAAATLQNILLAATQMLAEKEEVFLNRRPEPARWSPKEVLGHLIDSAYNNHRRFLLAGDQGHLRFAGYQQENWVKKNRYQKRDVREIISTFLVVQNHLGQMLKGLPQETLDRQTTEHDLDKMAMRKVTPGAPTSLGFLIEDYLFHLVHHLRQIDPEFSANWYLGYQQEA